MTELDSPCRLCGAPWYDLHRKICPDRVGIDWSLWCDVARAAGVLLLALLVGGLYGWMIFFAGRS